VLSLVVRVDGLRAAAGDPEVPLAAGRTPSPDGTLALHLILCWGQGKADLDIPSMGKGPSPQRGLNEVDGELWWHPRGG